MRTDNKLQLFTPVLHEDRSADTRTFEFFTEIRFHGNCEQWLKRNCIVREGGGP